MRKRFGTFLMVLCMCLMLTGTDYQLKAATGGTSVSVSSGSVNIGETITITAQAKGPSGERTVATMTLSYDSSVLQFVSCSTTYGGGGSSVTATSDSFTVTLKAVAAGNSGISLSASDGVVFDTNEELESMSGSSASVTVNNAASNGGGAGGSSGGGSNADGGNSGSGSINGGSSGSADSGQDGSSDGNTEVLSADNSLKSLTISGGTLSPAFTGKTTKYSATVANDVTSIVVSAVPANEKATVESVTGNTNLTVGSNAVTIVVRAENGVTATYKIQVTRKASEGQASSETPEEGETETEESEQNGKETAVITVNGQAYQVSEEFTDEEIPEDFSETTVNYHGTDYKGVSFDKGTVVMLSMKKDDDESTRKFFIYDAARDGFYPFVRLGSAEKYVIALLAPVDFTVPDNYIQTAVIADEENSITAYQVTPEEGAENTSDFSVFYAVNSEGDEGWYQFDALEGTYQRVNTVSVQAGEEDGADTGSIQEEYTNLTEKYSKEKAFSRNMIAVLIFIIAVLVVVIINLLIHRAKKNNGGFPGDFNDDDDSYEIDSEDEFDDNSTDEDDFDESGYEEAGRKKMFGFFRKRNPEAADAMDAVEDSLEYEEEEEEYLDEDMEDDFTDDDLSDWKIDDDSIKETMKTVKEQSVIIPPDKSEIMEEKASEEPAKVSENYLTEEEEEKIKREDLRKQFFAEENDGEAHSIIKHRVKKDVPEEEPVSERKKGIRKKAKNNSADEQSDIEIMDLNDL